MDGWEKSEKTKLPLKNAFYNKLNMKGMKYNDHGHWQQVCNSKKKMTQGCYHYTYVKTDVLLLTDVFDTFQNTCLMYCKLDLAYFCTAPGLAWQVLLKTATEDCSHDRLPAQHEQAKCKDCDLCLDESRLDLFREIDMLRMF